MALNKSVTGYTLKKEETLKDINGTGYYYVHNKTGARVVILSNDDENKIFGIAFRTPATDSTGVFHIIEHSVLCGSERFPVKDSFTEVDKGSLNTFLNAMTYPDKTFYPVASTNTQDFKNLMSVYADAVFNPLSVKSPESFLQEGWHYTLSEEGELSVSGVVYNEMQGVFSQPTEAVYYGLQSALFPDTYLQYESGGDPDHVPELTYEQYKKTHATYYHPSNSYTVIYGDVDFVERMEWLDNEYFSKYEKLEIEYPFVTQKPFGIKKVKNYYPAPASRDDGKGTYIAHGITAPAKLDVKTSIAINALAEYLVNFPGAPLKKALVDHKIGSECTCDVMSDSYQPVITILTEDAREGQSEDYYKVYREVCDEIMKNGLSKKTLTAIINSAEFTQIEGESGYLPKGFTAVGGVLDGLLYDDEAAFDKVHVLEAYEEIKKEIETDYFERVFRDIFMNEEQLVLLETVPDPELEEKRAAAKKEHFAKLKSEMDEAKLAEIRETEAKLLEYQNSEDSEEALATIPHLKRSDLNREIKKYNSEIVEKDGRFVHYEKVPSDGICYFRVLYNLGELNSRERKLFGILAATYAKIDTSKRSYKELNEEINIYTGGYGVGNANIKNSVSCKDSIYFGFDIKSFPENYGKALELLSEVIYDVEHTDTDRLFEIIEERKTKLEANISESPFSYIRDVMDAHLDQAGAFTKDLKGSSQLEFIKDIIDNKDKNRETLGAELTALARKLVKSEAVVALFVNEENSEKIIAETFDWISRYDVDARSKLVLFEESQSKLPENERVQIDDKNQGFVTPGLVNYDILQTKLDVEPGERMHGSFKVLAEVLNMTYLYEEVRLKGGAYGMGITLRTRDTILMYSYRDPHVTRTYDVYEKLPEYIENLELSDEEIDNFVISATKSSERPMSPYTEGLVALATTLGENSDEERQKTKDQVLDTTLEQMRSFGAKIRKAYDNGKVVCAIGCREKIEEGKALFDEIINL